MNFLPESEKTRKYIGDNYRPRLNAAKDGDKPVKRRVKEKFTGGHIMNKKTEHECSH